MLGVLGWVGSWMLQKQVGDQFCLVEYDLSHEYHKCNGTCLVTVQVDHD